MILLVKLQEPAQLRFYAEPNIFSSVIGKYFSRNQKKPYKDKYTFNKVKNNEFNCFFVFFLFVHNNISDYSVLV
jgi:hypothetical protein